ncbi:MAG: thioredoxin domain-containing protein [Acidobacteriota bacterium]
MRRVLLFCGSVAAAVAADASDLPGALPRSPDLQKRLQRAADAESTAPRTRHLLPGGKPAFTNRLVLSTSPYLKQHAHNPVDWYPWGDEAFALARSLGRPVLVSIGYSTCHWCHVMEEESFEDVEIAQRLNEGFIAIKVDREERPDVDAVYLAAVEAMTGGGGWPCNVWLTPDRQPFFGGTYFPPHDGDRGAPIGFATVLARLQDAWATERAAIDASATQLALAVKERLQPPSPADVDDAAVVKTAMDFYAGRFDRENGGLAGAPKFPSGLPLRLLLREGRRTGDARATSMATLTLERMAAGGIHDQIGGGFHRYSTDGSWRVPHFEKMLYDNALLALAYLDAYQVTHRDDFRRVVVDVLGWISREMTSPEGLFYAATDADSNAEGGERREGAFFTWTSREIAAAIGAQGAADALALFSLQDDVGGRSVLALRSGARAPDVDAYKDRLLAVRDRRARPFRDEKAIAAWNALTISAYARAGLVLDDAAYVAAAARAAREVSEKLVRDGRLLHSFAGGEASQRGNLADHAFLVAALLDLYEATGDASHLEQARRIDDLIRRDFEDPAGGCFATASDAEKLLVREKPIGDDALPSGNAVELMNLERLHALTTDASYRTRADALRRASGAILASSPAYASEMVAALSRRLDDPKEIVIVVPRDRSEAKPFLDVLRATYAPSIVLSVATASDARRQARSLPLLADRAPVQGKATAYVCREGACQLPTTDPAELSRKLAPRSRPGPAELP